LHNPHIFPKTYVSTVQNALNTLLKLAWGTYLLLTSLYCVLAFVPYTYYAFIKAPAYEWMPWFAKYHALLYWVALTLVAIAYRRSLFRFSRLAVFAALAAVGAYVAARPFLVFLHDDWPAYGWALAALAPLVVVAALDVAQHWPRTEEIDRQSLGYSNAIFVAILVALLYVAGVQASASKQTGLAAFQARDFEIAAWSVLSHVLLAILFVSVLNLIGKASSHALRARSVGLTAIAILGFGTLWILAARFLKNSLSFQGWPAQVYASALSLALTLFALSLVLPWFAARPGDAEAVVESRSGLLPKLTAAIVALLLAATAFGLPLLLSGRDWNGVLGRASTLVLWVGLTLCAYVLRPKRRQFSTVALIAIPLISVVLYKAAQSTAIFWGKPLGSTDDEIARALEDYGTRDASFELAHHFLGNSREQDCGNLCRILRQHTNIRNAEIRTDVNLVDDLKRTSESRPNIFIFVIDSLRPDYLGAYNPRVDFTPNLDALARESAVMRNAFTQYAGTTLSEPAIWSGAMLLHAHYMRPFAKVNSLEKLAKVDGYQMMVSYDTVLRELLTPSPDLIKLDAQIPMWNKFELCSTLQQAAAVIDGRSAKSPSVFFYAQPMNVHHYAVNDQPKVTDTNWRRPGFNQRIAYEVQQVDGCLGKFIQYLKDRGQYENSIIVVTSDHGDATGEAGRVSHSTTIFPEIMRVPLVIRLPEKMRSQFVYQEARLTTLTDIAPSLYYLLGHRPVRKHPLFGCPIFAKTAEELAGCDRKELLLASDVRAAYGILGDGGRFLYATYDSPAESFLFDLDKDPRGEHNIVSSALKKQYDEQIISHLQTLADFYGYKSGLGSLVASRY
jgi:Sulfatase